MGVPLTNFLNSQNNFEDQIFDVVLNEYDISISDDVVFKNCTFNYPLSFDNINIKGKLYFFNCKFASYNVIKNSKFDILTILGCDFPSSDKSVFSLFSNKCSILHIDNFNGNELKINGIYTTILILACNIKKLIFKDINSEYTHHESKIEFFRNNHIDKLNFECSSLHSDLFFKNLVTKDLFLEGEFKNRIEFGENLEIENLYFESSTFYKRLDINDGKYKYINFYRSHFQGLIWIKDYNLLENTINEMEIKSMCIHECIFENNISITSSRMERIDITNNNFKQLLMLSKNWEFEDDKTYPLTTTIEGINQGSIVIEKAHTDIYLGGINSGNISFKDLEVFFLHISDFQNKGNLSFSNIKSGYSFVIQNSIIGITEFIGSDISSFKELVFSNSNLIGMNFLKPPFNIVSFSSNPTHGYGLSDKSKNNSNLKSVYNQLKKNAIIKGDIDTALKYKSLENKYLFKEKNLSFDKTLLFLNKISNNHGLSWFRGVIFTLITAYVFFYIYIYVLGVEFTNTVALEDYIMFISSYPKLEIDKYLCPNDWRINLVIWISRIFISYGIYQTIAAFRKYGKT